MIPYEEIGNSVQFLLQEHPETIDIMAASYIFLGEFLVTCNFLLLFAPTANFRIGPCRKNPGDCGQV